MLHPKKKFSKIIKLSVFIVISLVFMRVICGEIGVVEVFYEAFRLVRIGMHS